MSQSTKCEDYLPKIFMYQPKKWWIMKTNEKIRQLRESRQWTQEEMATKLSMSTNGYAKIERGDTRSNLVRLEQISEVLGIDIVELLAYGEDGKINLTNSANNNHYSCIAFGDTDLKSEIQRLLLIISHKDDIIESQKKEIQLLTEINELLKNK